ncbi:DUF1810 domain-containing protein [Thauera sp. WH-1]|uniref:DUF1810 domain-containing protein n=1 Tax=Thauera sp. WH-1 TaxID=3398230 RepID=UPI0039FB9411
MTGVAGSPAADDGFDLDRFVRAQHGVIDEALAELRRGEKRTHWMWFVFPQLAGLGLSPTAQRYAIGSLAEAQAYLHHPLLGERLRACARVLLAQQGRSAAQIFGYPDELKLRSSMTLFAALPQADPLFAAVLERYFGGIPDARTLRLLGRDQ